MSLARAVLVWEQFIFPMGTNNFGGMSSFSSKSSSLSMPDFGISGVSTRMAEDFVSVELPCEPDLSLIY